MPLTKASQQAYLWLGGEMVFIKFGLIDGELNSSMILNKVSSHREGPLSLKLTFFLLIDGLIKTKIRRKIG